MLISKHFDPVLGIDIHILVIPPAGPVPIPHPHISLIFDVIDYVPILGATVKVGGLPRSTAGTAGRPIPHFPLGGPFVKPPMNEDEIFMGSLTVLADGGPLSYTALPSLSCHDIGMFAPPRKKPKKSFGMVLPTSVVLSIPLGMPVMVGGGPTIDMMGLAMMGGFAALGGAFKKLRALQQKSKRIRAISKKIHKRAAKAMKSLGVPRNVRNKVHKGICTVTGHPVDVATGKMFTDHSDFSLPGPLPLVWERTWYTTSVYDGPLGHGWHHSYDVKLCEMDDAVAVRLADGRSVAFPALDINETCFDRQERLTLFRDEHGYALDTKDKQRYRFTPFNGQADNQLLTSLTQNTSGAKIQFFYNEKGLLTQIIDSGGRLIQLSYTDDNRIHKIYLPEPESNVTRDHTNPNLFCAVEHHYRNGMLVQVDDALQQPLQYHYDNTLLIKETFRSGLSFYFEYDGRDHNARCLRTWGDGGIYYRDIRYDSENNITWVKDSRGNVTTYYHNGVLPHRIVDPLGHASLTEYNNFFEVVCETDELGYKTRYEFDERGNNTKVGYPDGTKIEYSFINNNMVKVIDQLGNTWRYEHDSYNRLTIKTDPLGYQTRYFYEGGLPHKTTDTAGNDFYFHYDQNFNLRSIREGENELTLMTYDALGNLLSSADNRGNQRRMHYDRLNRIIEINEPDGNIRQFHHDKENNVICITDKNKNIFFEYDGMGRLVSKTQNADTIFFEYDKEEQLISIINEHGNTYHFSRDANGEILTESGFDGVQRHFIRDPARRIIRINKPGKRFTSYHYEPLGKVREVIHSDGETAVYEYRADGELIKASNDSRSIIWEIDALGRPTKELQGNYWVASEYDPLGYRTRITSSFGLDQKIERNQRGDVLKVSTGKDYFEAAFVRDNQGMEIQRNLPGGIQSRWSRDRLGRPIKREINGINQNQSKSYVWGFDNRLLKIIDNVHRETVFQYDAFGNLLSARYSDNKFDLRLPDATGNLFTTHGKADREYGKAGQLLSGRSSKGLTLYQYDEEGNLISKLEPGNKRWKYEWNASGLLKKIIRPDGSDITFKYDPLGRRISKTFKNKTTHWVWDANNPLHEWAEYCTTTFGKLLHTAQQSIVGEIGTTQKSKLLETCESQAPPLYDEGTIVAPITWLFNPDSHVPMAKLVGEEYYSIITDYLGTPDAIFDKSGQLIWSANINVWGELQPTKGEKHFCPFRFPGQYEDSETGLYYNRSRYYDPSSGTYICQDPIGLQGGNYNLYAYVSNPCCLVDIFGLNTGIGNIGESFVTSLLRSSGNYFDPDIVSIQNRSGHGVDILAKNATTGQWEAIEVKTTTTGRAPSLSKAQAAGADSYTKDRLSRAARGSGHYKSLSAADRVRAAQILREVNAQGGIKTAHKYEVFVDSSGNVTGHRSKSWKC